MAVFGRKIVTAQVFVKEITKTRPLPYYGGKLMFGYHVFAVLNLPRVGRKTNEDDVLTKGTPGCIFQS